MARHGHVTAVTLLIYRTKNTTKICESFEFSPSEEYDAVPFFRVHRVSCVDWARCGLGEEIPRLRPMMTKQFKRDLDYFPFVLLTLLTRDKLRRRRSSFVFMLTRLVYQFPSRSKNQSLETYFCVKAYFE